MEAFYAGSCAVLRGTTYALTCPYYFTHPSYSRKYFPSAVPADDGRGPAAAYRPWGGGGGGGGRCSPCTYPREMNGRSARIGSRCGCISVHADKDKRVQRYESSSYIRRPPRCAHASGATCAARGRLRTWGPGARLSSPPAARARRSGSARWRDWGRLRAQAGGVHHGRRPGSPGLVPRKPRPAEPEPRGRAGAWTRRAGGPGQGLDHPVLRCCAEAPCGAHRADRGASRLPPGAGVMGLRNAERRRNAPIWTRAAQRPPAAGRSAVAAAARDLGAWKARRLRVAGARFLGLLAAADGRAGPPLPPSASCHPSHAQDCRLVPPPA